jgi:hypothetical protein
MCSLGCLSLSAALGKRPFPGGTIQRQRRPAMPIHVADMDEQRVIVVLDPYPMLRICLFMKPPGDLSRRWRIGNERRPATPRRLRPLDLPADSVCHLAMVPHCRVAPPTRSRSDAQLAAGDTGNPFPRGELGP